MSKLTKLRRKWFKPNNLIYSSYWGHWNKVLHYGEREDSKIKWSNWSVTVITCDKDGNSVSDTKERTHCTEISERDVELTLIKRNEPINNYESNSPNSKRT